MEQVIKITINRDNGELTINNNGSTWDCGEYEPMTKSEVKQILREVLFDENIIL